MESVVKSNEEKETSGSLITSPKPDEVLNGKLVKIQGKAENSQKVLFLSDTISDISTTKPDGTFEIEEGFNQGINLVSVTVLDKDFSQSQNITLPVYVSQDDAESKYKFIAGTAVKIFENTIAVNSQLGEINVKKDKNTKLFMPSPTPSKQTQPKSTQNEIQIGDYIVALGQKNNDTEFTATKIEVLRENKPKINKTYAVVKLASAAKNNIFSGSSTKDNKLLEFTLDKATQFIEKDKKADAKSIAKEKTAIIFYTSLTSGNQTTLVYIL